MKGRYAALAILLVLDTGCATEARPAPATPPVAMAILQPPPAAPRQPEPAFEHFALCGSEAAVPLLEWVRGDFLTLGLVPPGTVVVGLARHGPRTECEVETPLGTVRAWVSTDELGWYVTEGSHLSSAPVYVEAGTRVCRRDVQAGEHDAGVWVETPLGLGWRRATAEQGVAWVGTLPRSVLSHLPPAPTTSGTPPWQAGHFDFNGGAAREVLASPDGPVLLTLDDSLKGGMRLDHSTPGGAWVYVGTGPFVWGFVAGGVEPSPGFAPTIEAASTGALRTAPVAPPGARARAMLPTGIDEFPDLMQVVPGAPFLLRDGGVLVTPSDALALVAPVQPDGTHQVFLATDSGFLLIGRVGGDALQRYSAP